jgi:hypothetical protein
MRKGVAALTLLLVVGFAVWKAVPFLQGGRPDVYATPTVMPLDGVGIAVNIKKRQTACLEGIDLGPGARYAQVSLHTKRPSPPLEFVARGPGYESRTRVPGGLGDNAVVVAPLTPAPRNLSNASLCVRNLGRHQVGFYGAAPGRDHAPNVTTVDGRPADGQLSVRLLRSPSRSLFGQSGDIFDRIAAFRPVTGWEVGILALLVLIGAPLGLAVALARAAGEDDARDACAEQDAAAPPHPRGGW